jgi:hypothetical protein
MDHPQAQISVREKTLWLKILFYSKSRPEARVNARICMGLRPKSTFLKISSLQKL